LIVIEVFIASSGMVREERPHVAEMADRHADLADLAAGEDMVAVVAGLGRQIEGDGEAGLARGEVRAVEGVRLLGRGMAGIGPEQPGFVALRLAHHHSSIETTGGESRRTSR
jgi:hypothetical protein